jgi:polyisoprenyl-phosphate glycosyltransferase
VSAPELSVVVPVYNEQDALPAFHRRLAAALEKLGATFEIVYVDDGSADGTSEALRKIRAATPQARVLELSRNFGHQAAITAGLDHARGAACVVMDADGQDPPETIAALVARWKEGHQVVYAVRSGRDGESLFKRATAAAFYRLLRAVSPLDIPLDSGDFRLLDRRAVDALSRLPERRRFVRGLTAWIGFKQARVEYLRGPRLAGRTHYPLARMLRFALDGVTSFSFEPLRWVTYFGFFSFLLSGAIGVWAVYVKLFNERAVQGWTSLMIVVLFLGGVQLVSLGVIGEYLGRVFDEVKARPLYVVSRADE